MSTTHAADYPSTQSVDSAATSPLDFAGDWNWATLREAPAWVISLVVHLGVLALLGSFYLIVPTQEDLAVTTMIESIE